MTKDFIVGFAGSDNFTTIKADTLKSAKIKFCEMHNIKVSGYITSRRSARSPKDLIRDHIFN